MFHLVRGIGLSELLKSAFGGKSSPEKGCLERDFPVDVQSDPEKALMKDELIFCRPSTWFYRRIGILTALTGGLGLFFLYDGMIGYPKKNFTVDFHEAFEEAREASTESAPVSGERRYSPEQLEELKKAAAAGREGGTWAGFAAERLLSEKIPERYSEAEIREQFHFAMLMGAVSLGIIVFLLGHRRRSFCYDEKSLHTPSGKIIPFQNVIALDIRRWDRGIGLLTYREEGNGSAALKIDDYKYVGITEILKAICSANGAVEIEGDPRWLGLPEEDGSAAGSDSDA